VGQPFKVQLELCRDQFARSEFPSVAFLHLWTCSNAQTRNLKKPKLKTADSLALHFVRVNNYYCNIATSKWACSARCRQRSQRVERPRLSA